jgi:CheY-like chemotaxis protein
VVLMTAFTSEESIQSAVEEGVFAVLSKPCDASAVAQVVSRALRHPVVLVVDDVERDARSLVDALAAVGVRARAVFDGESALRAIEQGGVDVCLADLKMPVMDGVEVLARVRERDPSVTAIAFSAYEVPQMMRQVASAGVHRCLRKPLKVSELAAVIASARARAPTRPS